MALSLKWPDVSRALDKYLGAITCTICCLVNAHQGWVWGQDLPWWALFTFSEYLFSTSLQNYSKMMCQATEKGGKAGVPELVSRAALQHKTSHVSQKQCNINTCQSSESLLRYHLNQIPLSCETYDNEHREKLAANSMRAQRPAPGN